MTSAQVPMPELAGWASYGFGVLVAPGIRLAHLDRPGGVLPARRSRHDGALAGLLGQYLLPARARFLLHLARQR